MSARTKALKKCYRYSLISIRCANLTEERGLLGTLLHRKRPGGCWGKQATSLESYGGYTKSQAANFFTSRGWTYDEDGCWLCPVCTEGGS